SWGTSLVASGRNGVDLDQRSMARSGVRYLHPNKKETFMYKRILLATDGSKLSQKAVEHALNLADLTGAEVVALKIVPRYPQTYFEGGVALAASEVAKIEKQWHEEAMAAVNAVKDAGQKRAVKVKPITVKSDLIAEAIISAAKRNK